MELEQILGVEKSCFLILSPSEEFYKIFNQKICRPIDGIPHEQNSRRKKASRDCQDLSLIYMNIVTTLPWRSSQAFLCSMHAHLSPAKPTSHPSHNFSMFDSTIFNYTGQAQAPHALEWGKRSHSLHMQCSQEISQEYIQEMG